MSVRTPLFVSSFLLLVLSLLSSAVPARATTYYVAKGGNDSGSCTQSAPCLTIAHGVSLAKAGDVVQIGAGTYTETTTLSGNGSSSAKITVRGQDGSGCPTTAVSDVNHPTGKNPNSSVIMVGGFAITGSFLAVDCIHFQSSSKANMLNPQPGSHDVTLTNLEIDGTTSSTPGSGMFFTGVGGSASTGWASNYTVSNLYVHGTSNGFWVGCNNCTFSDSEITSLQGDEPGSDHDYIDLWGTGVTIRHNYIHNNTANSCEGYDCHMDCVQSWNTTGNGTEVSQNITIDRNICFNHHEGVIVQDNSGNGDVANWTVTNNVFAFGPWDDGSGHLAVAGTTQPWCWVFEDGKLGASNHFENNTCVDGVMGFRSGSGGGTGTADYKDNIFYSSGNAGIYDNSGSTTVTGANNLDYGVTAKYTATFTGDIVNKNPNFVSLGTGFSQERCIGCNFAIQSNSPAKGAGVADLATVDITNILRSTTPSIGAYEVGGSVASQPPPAQAPPAPTGLQVSIL